LSLAGVSGRVNQIPAAAIAAAQNPMMILVIRDFGFPFAQRKRTNSRAI